MSVITPGEEELVWMALQTEVLLDTNSGIVNILLKAYEQEGHWQTKRQILSLFADDFARAELQEVIHGLSKWRIDQVRQHATEAGKGQPLPEKVHRFIE